MSIRAFGPSVVALALALGCGGQIEESSPPSDDDTPVPHTRVVGRVVMRSGNELFPPSLKLTPVSKDVVFFPQFGVCQPYNQAIPSSLLLPVVRARSAADGTFSVDVPSGSYSVFVEHEGYLAPLSSSGRRCNLNSVDAFGDVVELRERFLEFWE